VHKAIAVNNFPLLSQEEIKTLVSFLASKGSNFLDELLNLVMAIPAEMIKFLPTGIPSLSM
jgi:hypothetical protein